MWIQYLTQKKVWNINFLLLVEFTSKPVVLDEKDTLSKKPEGKAMNFIFL